MTDSCSFNKLLWFRRQWSY